MNNAYVYMTLNKSKYVLVNESLIS